MAWKTLSTISVVLILLILSNGLEARAQDGNGNAPSTTKRPKLIQPTTTRGPLPHVSYCIKHPPNFLDVDLPCGGYDKPSCEKVCKQLGRTKAYCTKEVFCLCHNGDLYSC